MFIMQEIYYRTTGAVKRTKRLRVVYTMPNNGQYMRVAHIAKEGEVLPSSSYMVLPSLEVTASVYKDFEAMTARTRP